MSNKSTTIMKISLRLFNKFYSELTMEQQDKVLDIYYDFY
jgi:hypothetical protein